MKPLSEATLKTSSTPPCVHTAGPGRGTRRRSVREVHREEQVYVREKLWERDGDLASDLNPRRNPPPGPIDTDIDVVYQSLTSS